MNTSKEESSTSSFEVVVLGDVGSPEDCLRGLVHMTCNSVVKHLNVALQIISEKYGHSQEELSLLLRDDPRFAKSLSDQLEFLPVAKSTKTSTPPRSGGETLMTKKGKKVIIKKPLESG
jgi:hypothetical protein